MLFRSGLMPLQSVYSYQFYLNKKRIDSSGIERARIERFVLNELRKRPEIQWAFSYDDFEKVSLPSRLKDMFVNGFYPGRSGDIQIVVKPQYSNYGNAGVDHAAWYNYDTHIPLLWYGSQIPTGRSCREVNITDIAPTIAALLGIPMPGSSTGKVLGEVVK